MSSLGQHDCRENSRLDHVVAGDDTLRGVVGLLVVQSVVQAGGKHHRVEFIGQVRHRIQLIDLLPRSVEVGQDLLAYERRHGPLQEVLLLEGLQVLARAVCPD